MLSFWGRVTSAAFLGLSPPRLEEEEEEKVRKEEEKKKF